MTPKCCDFSIDYIFICITKWLLLGLKCFLFHQYGLYAWLLVFLCSFSVSFVHL